MSLSRASEMYGIPPTTLWQRANRMGIPTPKKDTANKNWSEEDLQRSEPDSLNVITYNFNGMLVGCNIGTIG